MAEGLAPQPLPMASSPVSTSLPDVRDSVAWRGIHAGLDEAAARGVPIVCLAEPAWSNGAQRLALMLEQDPETRASLENDFVPVSVDPLERPDVASRLRWAAAALTGTVGPPLLVVLTPRGAPFLAYCSLWPEGRGAYPSLRSLLRSITRLDRDRRAVIEVEAMNLQARARGRGDSAPRHTTWQAIRDDVDERFGGLREMPKHPRPHTLWHLLDECSHPRVHDHLVRTLDAMQRGGLLDQLAGSFHRCSRDERWIVPHFEKLVPQNAGLAAVYARAAQLFDRPDFAQTAEDAATFAAESLAAGVMVVASDTRHYTWTPRQFQDELDPALVQALGLHFKITRDDSPHVLFRALEPHEMTAYADESPDVLFDRILRGKEALTLARARRTQPERHAVDVPSWHAETLRWLFEAERHDVGLDRGMLERHLATLLDRPFEPGLGYGRGSGHWLEDQAAVAEACLVAPPGVAGAAEAADSLAALMIENYCDPESGALLDAPLPAHPRRPSQDLVDHVLSAAVPRALGVLGALARPGAARSRRSCAGYARAAERIERHHRDALLAVTETVAHTGVADRA